MILTAGLSDRRPHRQGCMKQAPARLWRGIAADLYDEYEPGKEITWWSVSSCTAAEGVSLRRLSLSLPFAAAPPPCKQCRPMSSKCGCDRRLRAGS
jgi:hypothetical protein